jgi:hypothetical protein
MKTIKEKIIAEADKRKIEGWRRKNFIAALTAKLSQRKP